MIFLSNAFNALEQLVTHKMRSLLTILAIVIAVTATITVVSVVQGFTRYVSNFLEGLGTNAVFVAPQRPAGDAGKALGRVELDENDFRAIESQCSALRRVSPLIPRQGAKLRYGREEITVNIEGVSPAYHTVRNFPVDVGRPFAVVDVERAQQVCVVGREILRKFDVDEGLIGSSLLLDGRRFRVIGILASKGSFFGQSLDDVVLIPYTTALKMYPVFRRNMVIAAQAMTAEVVPEAKAQIINLLRRRHGLEAHQSDDFIVQTQGEILAAFNNVGHRRCVGPGGNRRYFAPGRWHRDHECHAGQRHGTHARDWLAQSGRCATPRHHAAIPDRGDDAEPDRRRTGDRAGLRPEHAGEHASAHGGCRGAAVGRAAGVWHFRRNRDRVWDRAGTQGRLAQSDRRAAA